MSRFIIALTALILTFSAVPAQAVQMLTASNSQGLQAIVFLSDGTDFIQNWHNTPEGQAPYIQAIRRVKPGQALTAGFIASGFAASKDNQYMIAFDVSIINPAGQIVADEANYARASGTMVNNAFVLADPALTFSLSPQDMKGEYTVEITAKDQVAGTQAGSSFKFTLE